MADQPSHPGSGPTAGGDNGAGSEPAITGAPRWFKVFGIIAVVVLVLFVIVLFAGGGGGHGPGRHTGGGIPRGVTEPTAPEGGHRA
jgi:hypothetical protein